MGRRWFGEQLRRMAVRIGLDHPPGTVRQEVVEARVQAIWKDHPEFTSKQVIAEAGLDHPLGGENACRCLKTLRKAAANRSSVYRRIGWCIDCRTPTRIRISKILKRHPKFTATQIIEELGPGPYRRPVWVRQVMEECRRGRSFRRKVDRF